MLTGYSLVFAICLLPAGAWADRAGAARAFRVGVAVFAVTSVVCAVAWNLDVLLVTRALQGAAAAVVLPAGLSMLNSAVPDPAARGRAVGQWAAAGAIALVVGSPLGGAITSWLGWQSTFWLNIPLSLIVLAGQRTPVSSSPVHSSPGSASAVGSGSGAASTRVSGVVDLVRSRVVVVSSITGFALNFASYGAIFVVTFLLQEQLGRSAWATGLVFVPMTLLIVPANLAAGRLGVRRSLVAGQSLMGLGLLGLCFGGTAIWELTAWLLPVGVGAGLMAPSATTMMLDGVPAERAGLGSGFLNAARQLGSGAAPAIFAVLLGGAHFMTGYRISLLTALLILTAPLIVAVPAAARRRAPRRTPSLGAHQPSPGRFHGRAVPKDNQS